MIKKLTYVLVLAISCLISNNVFSQTVYPLPANTGTGNVTIDGELKKWHKVTLSFDGPSYSETSTNPSPFLDYRLDVTFTNGSKTYVVPGYFAADGNAAESSASSGNVWRVHFAPDEIGQWTYTASFKLLGNIAVAINNNGGTAVTPIHGKTGTFNITASDKTGRDNRSRGRLKYVGERYLKWAETGKPFIKAGADSPENFLAYEDFDNTPNSGSRRKSWQPHQQDYNAGDPTWKNGKGSEIIGAVNYLASEGLNVFSFLTMNINGDDKNVYPYVANNNFKQFDCSKLDQWEIVFEHADNNGFYLHFKTQETENEQLLNGGALGNERKLYYRELVARFGHHLALNWNMGEENGDYGNDNQTDAERRDMAQWFWDNDPYRHLVVVHTSPGDQEDIYRPLLGNNSKYTGISIQKSWSAIHTETAKWIQESQNAGKPWVVANDEQNGANTGVPHDWYTGSPDKHGIRKQTLWGNLMAGGAGVEYYFGYEMDGTDLDCQDYRSRDQSWDYCRYALEFLSTKPLDQMTPNDGLASGSNNWCLAKEGSEYIVYLREGGTANLNIRQNGSYKVRWYDPRNGGALLSGSVTSFSGTGNKALGNAPNNSNQDWVVYVTVDDGNEDPVALLDFEITNSVQRAVSFSGERSNDPDGTIAEYNWNFGDGATATGATATHTYSKDGTYQVSLTVVDNQGAAGMAYQTIIVDDGQEEDPTCITYGSNYVVFEAEATNSDLGQWKLRTPDYEDYMAGSRAMGPVGDDYLEFMGNNQDGGTATSPLEYTFVAPSTGEYRIVARMLQNLNGAAWDKCNDVYIRLDGDYTAGSGLEYSDLNHNQKFYGRGKDNWGSLYMLEVHNKGHKEARYFLKEGQEYTLTVSGRAQRTCIDYWLIYETSLNISTGSEIDLASENPVEYLPGNCGNMETCNTILAVDFDKWTNISGFTNASTDNQAGKDILQISARMATAAAQVTYTGANADVYFKINAMQETDGESTYALRVNGVKIGEATNDRIHGTGIPDYTIQTHEINSTKYALKNGDLIQVEFNNTTNGLVPEGNTTATSRGRWYSLDICTTGGVGNVEVTGINDLPATLEIGTGETATLTTSVIPSNATNKSINWSSSNTNIATVNHNGVVNGVNIGAATITAITVDGGFTTSCDVTVKKSTSFTLYPVHDAYLQNADRFNTGDLRVESGRRTSYLMFDLSSVSGNIVAADLTLTVGSDAGSGEVQVIAGSSNNWTEQNLSTANAPQPNGLLATMNATYSLGNPYTWELDEAAITTGGMLSLIVTHVSGNDVSFASKEYNNSSYKPVLTIKIADETISVDSVQLSSIQETVGVGACFQFDANVFPADADNKLVSWEIVGPAGVASVNNSGSVCGLSAGEVQLVVTTNDGGHTATAAITIEGDGGGEPLLSFDTPENNTNYAEGDSVKVGVLASDDDGISNVKLYLDDTFVRQENNAPYEWGQSTQNDVVLSNLPAGTYTLRAVAEDNTGLTAETSITINVLSDPTPSFVLDDLNKYLTTDYVVGGYIDVVTTFNAGAGNTVSDALGGVQVMLREVDKDWGVVNDYVFEDASAIGQVSGTSTVRVSLAGIPSSSNLADSNFYFLYPRFQSTSGEILQIHGLAPINIIEGGVDVTGVTLGTGSESILIGGTITLEENITPANATNKSVTWSSNNNNVASVVGGVVTANSIGTAVITVTTEDGGFTDDVTVTVLPISVTGVQLGTDSESIVIGNIITLEETVSPANATDKSVTWSSENTNVATVAGGVVTAINVGTTVITVITDDGGYTDDVIITVLAIAVTGVELDTESESLQIGSSITLEETVSPGNATNKSVTWSSDNPNIASVVEGVVTANGVGTAVINVTTEDGGYTDNVTITVLQIPVTGVELGTSSESILIGSTITLEETVSPANATDKSVTWSSENTEVATVAGGVVTAVNVGTTVITVTTEDGGYTDDVTITVLPIDVTGVELGTASESILIGSTITLEETVSPANATDKSVTWSSENTEVATVAGGVVTAINVGTTVITVTTEDGGFTAQASIEVMPVERELDLDIKQATIYIGDSVKLTALYSPADMNPELSWESDNDNIATVDENGLVRGMAIGNAVVTVSADGFANSVSCNITVLPVAVTGVSLDSDEEVIQVGERVTLSETVEPENATNKMVTWISADTTIAEVNGGVVTGKGIGETTINVVTDDGEYMAVCDIKVRKVDVEKIELSHSDKTLYVGDVFRLTASVLPQDATNQNVLWTSSNPEILVVDSSGIVTAKTQGNASVIATIDGEIIVEFCHIEVKERSSGISDLAGGEGITLYPNPVKEILTIELPNSNATATGLYLINSIGTVIMEQTTIDSFYQINLSDLTSGIYFIKVVQGTKIVTKRVVKE